MGPSTFIFETKDMITSSKKHNDCYAQWWYDFDRFGESLLCDFKPFRSVNIHIFQLFISSTARYSFLWRFEAMFKSAMTKKQKYLAVLLKHGFKTPENVTLMNFRNSLSVNTKLVYSLECYSEFNDFVLGRRIFRVLFRWRKFGGKHNIWRLQLFFNVPIVKPQKGPFFHKQRTSMDIL